jgi:hypothetical protein
MMQLLNSMLIILASTDDTDSDAEVDWIVYGVQSNLLVRKSKAPGRLGD